MAPVRVSNGRLRQLAVQETKLQLLPDSIGTLQYLVGAHAAHICTGIWARPSHICTGIWARPCHMCTGLSTADAPPLPRLRRNCDRAAPVRTASLAGALPSYELRLSDAPASHVRVYSGVLHCSTVRRYS